MFLKRFYLVSLLIIVALNALSFLAYNSPLLNWLAFTFILIATALFAWKNLYYGVLIILGELMISSQGHLFDVYLGTFRFSMRMGIFIIVFTVWGLKFSIFNFQFSNKINIQYLLSNIRYVLSSYKWYILFGLFILFGIINGRFLQNNNVSFLYQDANGYLFFLLLPVFITAFKPQNTAHYKLQTTHLLSVWAAAITWQFFASITLLFLYGHLDLFWRFLDPLYGWFREQRIIEVGLYNYNFYRVFMQSGLWVLTSFFVFLNLSLSGSKKGEKKIILASLLIGVITTLLISLSRSFWLGGFLGFLSFSIYYLVKIRPTPRKFLIQGASILSFAFISIVLIAGVLIAPIGKVPGLKSLSSIPERGIETEEAAISSRWNLLPPLWEGIKSNLIMGKGFGAVITYKTSDPRYLAAHPNNPYYTTFAFEWGWLDIWYKIGLLGLLTYLALLGSVLYRGWENIWHAIPQNDTADSSYSLQAGLFFGLIALIIVHFFTPFLNHPIGIGYILLCDALFRWRKG